MGGPKTGVRPAEIGTEAQTKAQRGWQGSNRSGFEKAVGGKEGRDKQEEGGLAAKPLG
jgi:hypothetical protein